MKAIIGPARSGKTTQLLEMAAAQDLHIVCADPQRRLHLENLARQKGLTIRRPLTYDQLLHSRSGPMDWCGFLFDDVDLFLHHIAQGRRIVAFAAWDGSESMPNPSTDPADEVPHV